MNSKNLSPQSFREDSPQSLFLLTARWRCFTLSGRSSLTMNFWMLSKMALLSCARMELNGVSTFGYSPIRQTTLRSKLNALITLHVVLINHSLGSSLRRFVIRVTVRAPAAWSRKRNSTNLGRQQIYLCERPAQGEMTMQGAS